MCGIETFLEGSLKVLRFLYGFVWSKSNLEGIRWNMGKSKGIMRESEEIIREYEGNLRESAWSFGSTRGL